MNCEIIQVGNYIICQNCQKEAASTDVVRACGRPSPLRVMATGHDIYDCVHRGQELRQVNCPSCRGNVRVKINACELFETCTIGMRVPAAKQVCASCDSRFSPLAAELSGPPIARPLGWSQLSSVIEAHRQLFRLAADKAKTTPYPGGFSGRGIVTLGGSSKYFTCAYLLVSLLREIGCQLPIEWWYIDDTEMDERMREIAESFDNVVCVNLSKRLAQHGRLPRRMGGWEAKVWSILYSQFEEVLFLDSDQLPLANPEYLFDNQAYRDAGAVFWPDNPPMGWSVSSTAFRTAGLPVPGKTTKPDWHAPTDYVPFETGQILVDKSRHWSSLELTTHFSDYSDFWYPRGSSGHNSDWIFGDKDTFFLAWQRLAAPYVMPTACRFVGSPGAGAFVQHDLDGRPVFQHKVNPSTKWNLHGVNRTFAGQAYADVCQQLLTELQTKWTGRIYEPDNCTPREYSIRQRIGGRKIKYRGIPIKLQPTTDGSIPEVPRHHWTVRELDGQPCVLVSSSNKVVGAWGPATTTWLANRSRDWDLAPQDYEEHNRFFDFSAPTSGTIRPLSNTIASDQHRAGWKYAIQHLDPSKLPILLDDFVEHYFCYTKYREAYKTPWVGIFHHPPDMPSISERRQRPDEVLALPEFVESLQHLRGAIALSEHTASWWRRHLKCPVITLKHPGLVPEQLWSPAKFLVNPTLLQIGFYLRNMLVIDQVPAPLRRVKLLPKNPYVGDWQATCQRLWDDLGTRQTYPGVEVLQPVSDESYDELLATCAVINEMFAASANNVVVDCIARNTPLFVNRHPAVVEYLGPNYPLYFDRTEELYCPALIDPEFSCVSPLVSVDRILNAHTYLTKLDKSWLSPVGFADAIHEFVNSVK